MLPLMVTPVFAQESTPPAYLFSGDTSIGEVIANVVTILFSAAGGVCVIFIIIGGYMWIVSSGDPSKVKQAQGTLTWAVIGLIVILVAVAALRVLTNFLGA